MVRKEISDISQREAMVGEKKVREAEFPTDPEERMAALLASFNASPKSIILLGIPQNGYISSNDLSSQFRSVVLQTEMGNLGTKNIIAYCRNTLVPIGVVAQEYIIDSFGKEELAGFGLTEGGLRYGIPTAQLALFFENRRNISLYSVFGQTGTASAEGKRAPYARARLLSFLYKQRGKVKEADVMKKLKMGQSVVQQSLLSLRKAGAIEYTAVTEQTDEILISYRMGNLSKRSVKHPRGEATLTKEIITICGDLMEKGVQISSASIVGCLSEKTKKRVTNKRDLRGRVSRIILSLSRQKFLYRKKFRMGSKSAAKINDKGRQIVEEFLIPLGELVNDNKLAHSIIQGVIQIDVLSNFDHYSRRSLELYYPYSSGKKRKDVEKVKEKICQHIIKNPGTANRDLADSLGYNPRTIWKLTLKLEKEKRIKSIKNKGVRNYYPVEKAA